MATLLSRITADFETSTTGAISVADTSFTLQSVTDDDGVTLSDGTYCFTLDRDNSASKEYIVGTLTSATKTVSSVSSVSRQGALTANFQKAHRIGTNVIISDHSALNAIVKILNGTGSLDAGSPIGYDTDPTISADTHLATKKYVDDNVNGGTVTHDKEILANQTAGETIATGNYVYLKSSDSRWYLVDTDTSTTYDTLKTGIALGAGTSGNTISNGVQLTGRCTAFTGLTANTYYYASATGGAITSTPTTPKIGIGLADSTTSIILDIKGYGIPTGAEKDALAGTSGTPSSSNKYVTADDVSSAGASGKIVRLNSTTLPTGIAGIPGTLITSSVASADIITDTNETTIISTSIPANTLGTNGGVICRVYFSKVNVASATANDTTIRLKYGSTTVVSMVLQADNLNGQDLEGYIDFVLFGAGTTSSQRGVISTWLSKAQLTANTSTSQLPEILVTATDTGTATEDSTGALTFSATAQAGGGTVEIIPSIAYVTKLVTSTTSA